MYIFNIISLCQYLNLCRAGKQLNFFNIQSTQENKKTILRCFDSQTDFEGYM